MISSWPHGVEYDFSVHRPACVAVSATEVSPSRSGYATGRWAKILAAALFAALGLSVVLTFRDYGISWDEGVQNTYGVKLLSFYSSGFRDRSAMAYLNLFYYGGFFDIVAALLGKI